MTVPESPETDTQSPDEKPRPKDMRARPLHIFFPYHRGFELTGIEKVLHRILRRIGESWRASPFRRVSQTVCMLLFLYSFFYVAWPYTDFFSADSFAAKEKIPVDLFLLIDPLVGLSTAIAAKAWASGLLWTVGILAVCIVIPRMFCGYFCPLGTLIDLFDWVVGRHFRRIRRVPLSGWWVHTKFYLLGFVLVSSLFGVLSAGYFSAIPVVTRGFLFSLGRLQRGLMRGFHELGAVDWTFYLSLTLFLGVLCLGLIEKRFWCRYVCPTGAVFSIFNFLRLTERKVDDTCIHCTKCVQICPFDAIAEDFHTRTSDCTFCQSCGGVCPTYSIQFVPRWQSIPMKAVDDPPVARRSLSRRGFLTAGVAAGGVALLKWEGLLDVRSAAAATRPIRPPGSVNEAAFLDLCIRCGECFKVCPGPVLHPAGIDYGVDSMWTPEARMTHAACHPDCNFCTQVCPTGAIQPLRLPVKRKTKMGLAKINEQTCFPHVGEKDCTLCYDECVAAGYDAIRMESIPLATKEEDLPPEEFFGIFASESMNKIDAPFIDSDACVGCGLCEYRCHKAFVENEGSLTESAITVVAENDGRG